MQVVVVLEMADGTELVVHQQVQAVQAGAVQVEEEIMEHLLELLELLTEVVVVEVAVTIMIHKEDLVGQVGQV
jgi:hypothetical protein